MPSSFVSTFTEPDEYAAAIHPATHQVTVTASGIFAAKLTRLELPRLSMQRFSKNLETVTHVEASGRYAGVGFLTKIGPRMVRNGAEFRTTRIYRSSRIRSIYQHTSGPVSYAVMALPIEEMVELGGAVLGRDLSLPDSPEVITPSRNSMGRLQQLHAAVGNLAQDASEVLLHPAAARGLEEVLIEAMLTCLDSRPDMEDRAALRKHAVIMRRFHRIVEQRSDEPLYIPELCKEVGASQRTLNTCCHEFLGTSPKRFLMSRRMNLLRKSLRESVPGTTTVTEIASQYGFWQFGRLAVEYKALFGETPSDTLARPA